MRTFLNSILSFIGLESLTDDEFATTLIQALTLQEFSLDSYNALLPVVRGRDQVSNSQDRLRMLFLAKGVAVPSAIPVATSNILVGIAL